MSNETSSKCIRGLRGNNGDIVVKPFHLLFQSWFRVRHCLVGKGRKRLLYFVFKQITDDIVVCKCVMVVVVCKMNDLYSAIKLFVCVEVYMTDTFM